MIVLTHMFATYLTELYWWLSTRQIRMEARVAMNELVLALRDENFNPQRTFVQQPDVVRYPPTATYLHLSR
jgi:hypothetical protein